MPHLPGIPKTHSKLARGIADDETVGPMRSRFETVFRPLAGSAGLREFDR
jgi:hypothetical protein